MCKSHSIVVEPTAAKIHQQQQKSIIKTQINFNELYTNYLYINKRPTQQDLILKNSLDILESTLLLLNDIQQDKYSMDLCLKYLAQLCPQPIHVKLNAILYTILNKKKQAYLNLKDGLQLRLVLNTLQVYTLSQQLDFECFLKILFLVKLIIIHRPLNTIKFFQNEQFNLIKVLNELF